MTGGRRQAGTEGVQLVVQALAQRATRSDKLAPMTDRALQRLDR